MSPDAAPLYVAAILQAAFMVRHYARGARTTIQRRERAAAIERMGLTVRQAFNASQDFELLLSAIVDGLAPHDARRF